MFYVITASVTEETEDGSITRQIPTFILNEDIQGITNHEHAKNIAETILNSAKNPKIKTHIHASKQSELF
jgi:hypothetical protein